MKQVEKIWAELSAKQVELSEGQVELATTKEVASMASKVNALQKKVYKQAENAEAKGDIAYRATLDLNDSVSELKDLMSILDKDMNNISKQLKDLGMNPNDVPSLSSSLDIIKAANQAVANGEREVKNQAKGFKV